MNLKIKILLSFLLIYTVFCFLSLNRHSSGKLYTYHSELWADKAGYNVYLPTLFIYDFDGSQFPEHIVEKTGYGFSIDSTTNRIITKYPYGVALLQSPFWLLAHSLSPEKDGFSVYYQKSIDFAGSFYLTLGLFFLFFTINKFKSKKESIFLSLVAILSSGIFYYGIFETGMSHVYSFFCLSALLYFILSGKNLLYIAVFAALYVVVRPINAIFLLIILGYFIYNKTLVLNKSDITFKTLGAIIVIGFIAILPQSLYYNYAFDSMLTNSYKNEPFILPTASRVLELLIGPNNGLLLYYPIIIILLWFSLTNKNPFNKLIITLFLVYVLIYSAWWSLSLGCGFGHRAFNDIFVVFVLPFIFSSGFNKKLVYSLIIICILLNVKFIFSYDTCLHNSLNWRYLEYKNILFGEFK